MYIHRACMCVYSQHHIRSCGLKYVCTHLCLAQCRVFSWLLWYFSRYSATFVCWAMHSTPASSIWVLPCHGSTDTNAQHSEWNASSTDGTVAVCCRAELYTTWQPCSASCHCWQGGMCVSEYILWVLSTLHMWMFAAGYCNTIFCSALQCPNKGTLIVSAVQCTSHWKA